MFYNYLLFQRVETVLIGEKANKLSGINKQLNALLTGTFTDILSRRGISQQASKAEKIAAINLELKPISDLIAECFPGIGVGYYSKEIDAVVCYAPKEFNQKVGLSIDRYHVGRRCMEIKREIIAAGAMVRGEIMNCVAPIIRGENIIGFTWANETLEDVYSQIAKGGCEIFFSPDIEPLLGLTGMLLKCSSLLLYFHKTSPGNQYTDTLQNITYLYNNLDIYIKLFINSLDLSVIVCDKDLIVNFCSRKLTSFGINQPESFIGQRLWRLFDALDFREGNDLLNKLKNEEKHFLFENIELNKKSINVMMTFVFESAADPAGTIIVFEDLHSASIKEDRMQHIEALVATEQMALTLAHEIHNPLTVIRESLKVLERRCEDKEFIPQFLLVANKAIDRIDKVTSSLMELEKYKNPEFTLIDIHTVMRNTLELIFPLTQKNNVIVVENYGALNSKISGDPVHLQTAFINLLYNAIQAMADGGTLSIKTNDEPESKVLYIEIGDTGHGIPDEIKENIFKLFYTTKMQGSGIGLSLAYNIICKHQGILLFNSEVNKGTTFTIVLPKNIVYRIKG